MSLPNVSVSYANGNLLADVSVIDGIAGMCGTVNTNLLFGKVFQVFSLDDAETKGFTEIDEPTFHRHLKEFYGEVAGNQELWIMGVPAATTMANMVDDDDETGAKLLIHTAGGKIRLLGVFRNPDPGYNAGAAFLDADVEAAILKAKTFCEARLEEIVPLRVIIEGRVNDEDSVDIFEPKTASNGFAGVVLGGTLNDGSASIGTMLGRAVSFPAHIKIGKVQNGPLSITSAFIGTKKITDMLNLESLHDKGFISFMTYTKANKAGFYFGIDHMASTDDYRLLVYGRVIDKAAVIGNAVYTEDLESEIDVNEDGTIDQIDIEHLASQLKFQIDDKMGDQISKNGAKVIIDPKQNVISTSELEIELGLRPKGYATFIKLKIALSAPIAS